MGRPGCARRCSGGGCGGEGLGGGGGGERGGGGGGRGGGMCWKGGGGGRPALEHGVWGARRVQARVVYESLRLGKVWPNWALGSANSLLCTFRRRLGGRTRPRR